MQSIEDQVVLALHAQFDSLPSKGRPRVANGPQKAEWIPFCGIATVNNQGNVECISLATGMKCLPLSKLAAANGNVLHDWHAEILALRAFNYFLLKECQRLSTDQHYTSPLLRARSAGEGSRLSGLHPYTICEQLRIFMYCSEAPCGDASMELVMERQEDSSPWPVRHDTELHTGQPSLLGRGSFSQLGNVRRKPARADSPVTLSKSCSDKIALKQCTSLLSALASQLISPENAYLDTLILPEDQIRNVACRRCFGPAGRMSPVTSRKWSEVYSYKPFNISGTSQRFPYSRAVSLNRTNVVVGSNLSVCWTPYAQETLVNGVLQGRRQNDPRGASQLSRRKLASLYLSVEASSGAWTSSSEAHKSYKQLKSTNEIHERRQVKLAVIRLALNGWAPNGDDDFDVEVADDQSPQS